MLKRKLLFNLLLLLFLSGCQTQKIPSSTETVKKHSSTPINETKEESQMTTTESINHASFSKGSLIEAMSTNDLHAVDKILQDKSYNLNETNDKGESSLLIATHNNYIEVAKRLIDAGADINQQDQISDSPYLYAGAQGKTEILAYMLNKQVPNQQKVNRFGGNALIPAAEKGHLENVKLLLEDGRVDINHQNNYGYTALIEAVALRDGSLIYQQIVEVLLKAGADKSLRDHTGRTALDYAESLGYSRITEILQKY